MTLERWLTKSSSLNVIGSPLKRKNEASTSSRDSQHFLQTSGNTARGQSLPRIIIFVNMIEMFSDEERFAPPTDRLHLQGAPVAAKQGGLTLEEGPGHAVARRH